MDEIARVTRSKEQAKAVYNRLSRGYDLLAGRFEGRFREAGLRKLAAREGERVLEIGFGTGHCSLALARAVGDSGRVYGIDLSEGMLDVTASRLREARLSGRAELILGDAASLPFESDFFDAVFTSFTLELFDTPEIPLVLAECRRVLRPGGRLCVVAMSKEGNSGAMVRLYELAHKKFPNYGDCRPIYVSRAVENAGFKIASTTRMSLLRVPVEVVLAEK